MLFVDRACDVSLGRFLGVLSSKIPTGIVTDHPYGSWETAENGWRWSRVLFVDRACDVSLGRFLGMLSSKITKRIVTAHPYGSWEMAENG